MLKQINHVYSHFETKYRNSNNLVCVTNEHKTIIYVNDLWLEKIGFTKQEIINTNLFETLVIVEDYKCPGEYSGKARKKNGDVIEFKGSVGKETVHGSIFYIGICREKDLKLFAKSSRLEIEKYFHYYKDSVPRILSTFSDTAILDELPIGISVMINDTLDYVYVNNHYSKNLGYKPTDFLLGKVRNSDITHSIKPLSDNVVSMLDFKAGFNDDFYIEKTWRHKKGYIVEGRIIAQKFTFPDDDTDFLLSVISFRKNNAYKLLKTPKTFKRTAELLGVTERKLIETAKILEEEGLFSWKI
tara:strand:+ start:76 stop:975 length:900 start_codon:yes stop_codon:yes gene_type:complete